jgi:hypothetical protein
MGENRLRVHPFDLAVLDPFVEAYAADLGAEAMAYAQRNVKIENKRSYFAPESVSDETWMLGNRAEKAKYIAKRRSEDPEAALRLVEVVWQDQDVESRVRLVGALRVGVSIRDKDFFASLVKDRSPRIRDVARSVLVRLPDYSGDDGHLQSVKDRVVLKEVGLPMMRRKEMRLELPTSVGRYGASDWVLERFGKIGVEEFAASFSMPIADIVKAASADEHMTQAILVMAAFSGDARTAGFIVNDVQKDEGSAFFSIAPTHFEHLTDDERTALAENVVRPENWSDFPAQSMERTHDLVGGSASDRFMDRFLDSTAWRHLRTRAGDRWGDGLARLAVICPPSRRALLRNRFKDLDPNWVGRAILFLEIIEHLESTND